MQNFIEILKYGKIVCRAVECLMFDVFFYVRVISCCLVINSSRMCFLQQSIGETVWIHGNEMK